MCWLLYYIITNMVRRGLLNHPGLASLSVNQAPGNHFLDLWWSTGLTATSASEVPRQQKI